MHDARDPRPRGRSLAGGALIGRRGARSFGVSAALIAVASTVTACGSSSAPTSASGAPASSSAAGPSGSSTSAASISAASISEVGSTAPNSTAPTPTATAIVLEFDGRQVAGSLDPSPTSASLIAQLPLELTFGDHAGQEKSARLPMPLSLDGSPERSSATPLTIGYYAPDQVLVLYYEPVGTFAGIVPLGTLTDLDAIASTTDDFTATLRVAG